MSFSFDKKIQFLLLFFVVVGNGQSARAGADDFIAQLGKTSFVCLCLGAAAVTAGMPELYRIWIRPYMEADKVRDTRTVSVRCLDSIIPSILISCGAPVVRDQVAPLIKELLKQPK